MKSSGSTLKKSGNTKPLNADTSEHYLTYETCETQVKYLQGKVLTVIDASIPEEKQNKAIKDLVNKMFSDQLNWIYDITRPDHDGTYYKAN